MEKKSPSQLYSKLFCIYSVLIIGIVSSLAVLFLVISSKSLRETNME